MNTITKLNTKLNDAINRSSSWKIFFVTIPIVTIFIFVVFSILFYTGTPSEIEKFTPNVILKIIFIMSILFSIMITLLFSMSKQSDKFWENAKELENLIDEKNTRDELEDLYQTKFKEVQKLSAGPPHYSEVKRLHSIMKMKYKLIK